jgi:hypothetical protein
MANLISATAYQIDGSPLDSPIQVSFLTSDIMVKEAVVGNIAQVNAAIFYYPNTSNKLQDKVFFVSETLSDLLALANSVDTTQVQATVVEINSDPQVPGGVQYTFPVHNIAIFEYIDAVTGANSNIQYKNKTYSVTETESDLVAAANLPILYSATFFDTTLQTNGGATTANQVRFDTTQQATGFTLGPDNRINVLNSGTYLLNLLLQLSFTGGASNYNVTVWFTVNDVIVDNSAFTFTTTGAQNDQTLANITDTIALTAGQYLKFYWWSQATGMRLLPTAAGSNPTRPASPSVNFSIFNVG